MKPNWWRGIWAICWIATLAVAAKKGRFAIVSLDLKGEVGSVVRLDTWTGRAEQALFLAPNQPVILREIWDRSQKPVEPRADRRPQ